MKRQPTSVFECALNMCAFIPDRMYLNDQREVKKVEGRVPYLKPINVNGEKRHKKCYHHVRWDAFGKSFARTTNERLRDYDLPMQAAIEEQQSKLCEVK